MGKKKPSAPVTTATPQENESQKDNSKPEATAADVSIPVGLPAPGYCPDQINTRLSRRQGAALKALFCRLSGEYAKCEMEGMTNSGKIVEAYPHALRWLLDRVADSLEESTGEQLVETEGLVFR